MEPKLSAILLDRAAIITQMKNRGLDLKWLREYPIPCLMWCCDRMEETLPGISITEMAVQRELIENKSFSGWYAKLLPLFPKDPPPEPKPEPAYKGRNSYYPPPRTEPLSRRAVLMAALCRLLEACNLNGKDITAYPQDKLLDMLERDHISEYEKLVFLENFVSMELPEDTQQRVLANLHRCVGLPLELDERQKALLVEPYVATRQLFMSAPFGEVLALLDDYPALLNIVRLLHEKLIWEGLDLEDYRTMAQDAPECHRLLEGLIAQIGHDAVNDFIQFWKKDGCPLRELRTIEAQSGEHPELDWAERLSTYAGYVNQLYGSRFKNIDLASASAYQEDILVYAIVKNKRHFIRLIDDHTEEFLNLPSVSFLFQEKLYREHFNLNELTEQDLKDCAWMVEQKLRTSALVPGRRYIFPELKALYDVPKQYITFYHALQSPSQDYRLKVFRQVQKRRVLSFDMEDADISALAAYLDSKPLDAWMQTDFGHISGLTASDAVQMLVYKDKLVHLLPGIQTKTEVSLVLRNLDAVGRYQSVSELKENLVQTDADWHTLVEEMNLTQEFQEQYRENIIGFLCNNGAYIAETYGNGLKTKQREAFYRVVKAELMGRLNHLKYYEGDLQRELDSPLTQRVRAYWSVNLSEGKDGVEVREHDDFFSTMLLGTQPQRTCLAYTNGAYKHCLLSAFDSNKKILYATLGGRVVGRAFLRLTKGRLTGSDAPAESSFTFVDLEHIQDTRPERVREQEGLTLFLERPYISGIGPAEKELVTSMFVSLAERKADELGTMLVLSAEYREKKLSGFTWTQYAIYISKSKAGAQYLDSLNGQAEVSSEGSYKSGSFLVRSCGVLPQIGVPGKSELQRAS